jgi:transcriptional regulator with XRE-family HTH domain
MSTETWTPTLTLGDRIGLVRRHLGLSSAEAAKRAGISRNTWINWESGRSIPTRMTLLGIAAEFGVDQAWFMDTDQYPWPLDLSGTLPALYLSGEDFARTLGP